MELKLRTPYVLREAAEANGWRIERSSSNGDTFVHDVLATDQLLRMQKAGGVSWQPQELIRVTYNSAGHIHWAYLATPGQQSMLTGKHVGYAAEVVGSGRRDQVLAWLRGERVDLTKVIMLVGSLYLSWMVRENSGSSAFGSFSATRAILDLGSLIRMRL